MSKSGDLAKILLLMVIAFFASPAVAGDPYFNLSWYLRDVVVTSVIDRGFYEQYRGMEPVKAERFLRDRADKSTVWIERLPDQPGNVTDIKCATFRIQIFEDWKKSNSEKNRNVPQWREAWHGVSTWADLTTSWSGVKQVHLAAAVRSPGIPQSAFEADNSGRLRTEFFDAAATYRKAGFDRMQEAVSDLTMRLVRSDQCDGFELYIWEFRR